MSQKISVLGAGSWGTALAILAAKNGCQTLLWGHSPTHIARLNKDRKNQKYLPNCDFPDNLSVTADLAEATKFSPLILISVPSHAFKQTLVNLKPFTDDQVRIAWATKGFNAEDGSLLQNIISQVFQPETPSAILSGPTFAEEVANNLPTAITIASYHPSLCKQLSDILHSPRFRIYTSSDIIGVQVGGAVKNVLAIAAGIADGLKLGANTRAALITRGLSEIMRLGLALGGKQETFMGLAGLGDLILTCTDNQSRNRRLGLTLGQGKTIEQACQEIGQEIEGIAAAKQAYLLAQKHQIEMPIIEQTYLVLYENLAPSTAVQNLLKREQKPES